MLFKSAALVLGLAVSVSAQQFDPIAGYAPRTNATDFLERDLIQAALEDLISDETCVSFALADDFYYNGPGTYFQAIPTYTSTISDELNEYIKFYGRDNFVQIWAEKAIKKKKTTFVRGGANFGVAFPSNTIFFGECVGFEEALKKGLSFTGALVEMFQLGQKAIDAAKIGCKSQGLGCNDGIAAWDAATAIYVGSLEGTFGNNNPGGSYGKSPYALADLRCRNFANCGPDRNEGFRKDLTSPVNTKVLAYFQAGSHAAWLGDYKLMERYLRLISNKVAIPLIQGTLRHYYRLSDEFGPGTFSTADIEVARGGAFVFGVLPKVWACSSRASKRLEVETKIGGGVAGVQAVNYQTIRLCVECNYRCLGITCDEVGSLFDGDMNPKPGAEACDDEMNGSLNTCSKMKPSRKNACKLFTGSPGIKGRDRLKFTGASY